MNRVSREGLGVLLERGAVFYDFPGNSIREILEALVAKIPTLPSTPPIEDLLEAVLEREALMSTGIGHGIAIPHPRNPMAANLEEQFAILAFLKNPVDWKALDAKPVDTVLFIVSSSAKSHLKILSGITFFCQNEAFLKLLRDRAPGETLIAFIKDTEREWET